MTDDALNSWLDGEMEQERAEESSPFQVIAPPDIAIQIRRSVIEALPEDELQNLRIEITDVAQSHGRTASVTIEVSGVRNGTRFDKTLTSTARRGRVGTAGSIMAFAQNAAIQDVVTFLRELTGNVHPFSETAATHRTACLWASGTVTLVTVLALTNQHVLNPSDQGSAGAGLLFVLLWSAFTGGGLLLALRMTEPLIAPSEWLLEPGAGRRWFVRAGIPESQNVRLLRAMCVIIAVAGLAWFAFCSYSTVMSLSTKH